MLHCYEDGFKLAKYYLTHPCIGFLAYALLLAFKASNLTLTKGS